MKNIIKTLSISIIQIALVLLTISCSDTEDQTAKYPAPVISSFSPSEGLPGSIVTISGSEYGATRTDRIGRVYFGGVEATQYASWSDKEIKVRVPANGKSGNITLWVWKNNIITESEFTCVPGAEISSIQPSISFPGSTITLTGKNFGYFLKKGLTASDVTVTFKSADSTVTAVAKSFDETSIGVEVPTSAKGGAISVSFGNLQTVNGPELTLIGDYKFTLTDYVALKDVNGKGGMVSATDIGNTKNGSYVIYKFTAPATGLFDIYALAGTTKSGSYLNVDLGTDQNELSSRAINKALTQTFTKGTWNDNTKYTFGPYLLREGNTYYLRILFLQDGTTWVGNVHELGMSLDPDQTKAGAYVVDNTKSLGYTIYQNDFNSGTFFAPFRAGWAESPNYIKVTNQYCEFYFNQAALDANPTRRMLKGCELTCDYQSTTSGWYGFKIYLPEGKFPKDVDGTIIAQFFNQGDKNSWAGHLSISKDKLLFSHRYALIDPTVGTVGTVEWNKWIPVVAYFKVGRNGKGRLKAWMGDNMQESKPNYDSGNCNFGFGNWIDDDTLDGTVSNDNAVADAIGAKFGMYVSTGGDRIIRFDDVKLVEGNPSGAFNIVKPS